MRVFCDAWRPGEAIKSRGSDTNRRIGFVIFLLSTKIAHLHIVRTSWWADFHHYCLFWRIQVIMFSPLYKQ